MSATQCRVEPCHSMNTRTISVTKTSKGKMDFYNKQMTMTELLSILPPSAVTFLLTTLFSDSTVDQFYKNEENLNLTVRKQVLTIPNPEEFIKKHTIITEVDIYYL